MYKDKYKKKQKKEINTFFESIEIKWVKSRDTIAYH